ncbi:hypothetical protein N9463_01115 [Planktomarina sp.]|nr:hypothetical protein [Planktomarina sp.]
MLVKTSSATEARKTTRWVVIVGLSGIVTILALTGFWLLWTLPDGNAFNARVEQIFVQNDAMTSQGQVKLLEILAQSGTAFSDTLASYRAVIFVLLLMAAALLLAAVAFLSFLLVLNRRVAQIETTGIQVSSLLISRAENLVILNNMEFQLTQAAIETISVLAEARMDGEMLNGAELESVIVGRPLADCDEAAGATRIKRLRDSLGNQMISTLLIKNVARRGYVLAIDKNVIEMI